MCKCVCSRLLKQKWGREISWIEETVHSEESISDHSFLLILLLYHPQESKNINDLSFHVSFIIH